MRDYRSLRKCLRIIAGLVLAVMAFRPLVLPANALDASQASAIAALKLDAAQTTSMSARTRSSHKSYFVEFRARSAASYGHMYVIYGKLNSRGEIVKSDIAGLHPAGDSNNCVNCSVVPWMLGHLLFVPAETGASDGDLEEKYVSARYRVLVDADTFKTVSAYIGKLKAENPVWNALWRNCVSFGNDIAGKLDLKTPGFVWMEPKDYVEHLRDLNGGKPQRALKFAAPAAHRAHKPKKSVAEEIPVPRRPKQAASTEAVAPR